MRLDSARSRKNMDRLHERIDDLMVMVGAVEPIASGFDCAQLIFKRKSIAGSLIGGIKETQEMLDFCAKHQVLPDVEMIRADEINNAFERMLKNDVKYRFVIDEFWKLWRVEF